MRMEQNANSWVGACSFVCFGSAASACNIITHSGDTLGARWHLENMLGNALLHGLSWSAIDMTNCCQHRCSAHVSSCRFSTWNVRDRGGQCVSIALWKPFPQRSRFADKRSSFDLALTMHGTCPRTKCCTSCFEPIHVYGTENQNVVWWMLRRYLCISWRFV